MKKYLASLLLLLSCGTFAQEYISLENYHTIYTINSYKDVLINEEYKMTVHSEQGKLFAIFREYMDKFRSVRSVEIVVKDASGKKIKKLSKGDGVEIGFNPNYEINDSKMLIIDPDYQSYPYTLEIKSTVKLNGFISLPVWSPRPYFHFSVKNATLKILASKDIELSFREENIKTKAKIYEEDKKSAYEYEIAELASLDQNIRYKEFYARQPKVYISPKKFEFDNVEGSMESWADFGDWFLGLNKEAYTLTGETKAFLDAQNAGDIQKLIANVYKYMQDRVRYVSIQLGIGGYKSLPTEEVEANGYGDCKALTTYMKNLLDYKGINSNYILARAGRDVPDVIAEFPSNQFNHVFLGIPNKSDTIYLECTSQTNPSDYTGTFTDDRNVLWISEGSSKIIRSRIYSEENNILRTNADIVIDDEGNGLVNLHNTRQGIFYEELLMLKSASEDYVKKYNINKFNYADFTIDKFSYKEAPNNITVFETEYILTVNGVAKPAGGKLIMPMNLLNPFEKFIDYDEYFEYAEISRAFTVSEKTNVELKNNYWFYKIPNEFHVETKFGNYILRHQIDGENITIIREFTIIKGSYNGEQFKEFKEFLDQVKRAENGKIVLDSKT